MDFSNIFKFTLFFLFLASSSNARDIITPNQPLKDTGEQMISRGGQFELGFFNLGVTRRYLGIRYHNIAKNETIWVANRNTPLNDTSGVLTLTPQGTLLLSASNTSSPRIIWQSNVSTSSAPKNPIVRLLDTGNLVVANSNSSLDFDGSDDYLWESFDYPGNTIMPNMKFGRNLVTGLDKYLSSWKTNDDPSEGHCTNILDPSGYPQIFLRKDREIVFRSGPWNGERYSGMPNLKPNGIYTYEFVINEKEIYYQYNLVDNAVISRIVLTPSGMLQRLTWNERRRDWDIYLTVQMDNCDRFNRCGPYGSCYINNSPPCSCLIGFEPKDPMAWNAADWNDGCVRRVKLECRNDGFKRISGLKLPDTRNVVQNSNLSLKECERLCHENCSCTAYANSDIRNGGSGCLMWFDELIDIRVYSEDGQDLYVRMAASELGNGSTTKKLVYILVPVISVGALFLLMWLILCTRKQRKLKREGTPLNSLRARRAESSEVQTESEDNDLELPLYDFAQLHKATQHFSLDNKLGQGGFGLVYKGILNDGQEVAVKRLSKHSNQGISEFKNEVSCIAKLQHRNLVKLFGCCIQEEEKMLVYEYMPNKSLDLFIFDQMKSKELHWPKRFNIINGIARGILYLHHDSRLRIIHRDLKASNVLLDHDLNSKISDFGMARIFGGDETDQASTNRIVGTYGYMAPEYAVDGFFSVKSDVYSFGVLVLEIVSGKKNRGFSHPSHDLNLLGHAWRLYNDGRSWELLDPSINEPSVLPQVLRAIHVGLLCVQQAPEDRPSMSMVVLMLGSNIYLPDPKEPGFFTERKCNIPSSSSSSSMLDTSINEVSLSFMDAR